MKMENEVWKPEVGKTAWVIDGHDIIKEVVVVSPYGQVKSYFEIKGWGLLSNRHKNDIHPTAEAALASIKVYDLEGNEVVLAHDRVVEQVKVAEEEYLYECPVCDNVDGLCNFCSHCGVEFGKNPVGGFPHQHIELAIEREDDGC